MADTPRAYKLNKEKRTAAKNLLLIGYIIGNYIIVANEETGVSVIDRRNKKEVYNLPLSCPLNVIKI